MTDAVRVAASVTRRRFDVTLALPERGVTAIVGPNGAGKSTLIQLISGQLRPDDGSVSLRGEVVSDATRHIPPYRRTVALLEQRPLLFPHLSVLDNVAFGVRARGAGKAQARERARHELDAVGAAHFAERRVSALSGGEAQRVAMARALAIDPTVILLDEPLAALDVTTAAEIRGLLAARLRGSAACVALVTHDPLDVWALADRVVALEAGRVTAAGDVADLLGRPPTGFLARFSGVNLLAGTAVGDGISSAGHHVSGLWATAGETPPGNASVANVPDDNAPGGRVTPTTPVLATFPPSSVALYRDPPHGSPRNVWPVTVTGFEPRGATVHVLLRLDVAEPSQAGRSVERSGRGAHPEGFAADTHPQNLTADSHPQNLTADSHPQNLTAELTAQGVAALDLAAGDRVFAQVKATQVTLYAR